ncbi:MAG: SGNH/GDSL hydrolase family protein [Acidobacteriota bacterium]
MFEPRSTPFRLLSLAVPLAALAATLWTPPAVAQPSRVVALGDSITLGLRMPGVQCLRPSTWVGYPALLASRLEARGTPIDLTYSADCGDTTAEVMARLTEVVTQGHEIALLKIGTNDFSSGVGWESLLFDVEQIAEDLEAAGIVPVLSSVIPYGWEVRGRTTLNGRAGAYAEGLQALGDDTGRIVADPYNRFLGVSGIFDNYYDEDGYHPNAAGYGLLADAFVEPTLEAVDASCRNAGPCVADDDTLCLLGGRYQVEVAWRTDDGTEGVGRGEAVSDNTGRLWFFDPQNLELLIKVLDGRCVNDHVWVYFGALSNVEFAIEVRDTVTCAVRRYENPSGTFASLGDTEAFADSCPAR